MPPTSTTNNTSTVVVVEESTRVVVVQCQCSRWSRPLLMAHTTICPADVRTKDAFDVSSELNIRGVSNM